MINMHFLAHVSYPYVAANLAAWIIGKPVPIEYGVAIIFFSIIPDFDYIINIFNQLITTGKYKIPMNHHGWPSHWPIIYTPLIVASIVTGNIYVIIATIAIYIHLAMDTMFCNQGIMIFYPFNKKWYNFFSESTKGKGGLKWNDAYSKLMIYKFDWVAFIIAVIILTFKLNTVYKVI